MTTSPSVSESAPRGATPLVAAALLALVGLLYGPPAHHDFVPFDDPNSVLENPPVREGLSWDSVRWAFTESHSANWHPLTWLSHVLDCELFGLDAGAHHLVNAALHALNAVLLLAALRRLTGRFWPSAAVALLFAVHPLRVESVAWIAERKDVLSGTFAMLTLLAWNAYARRGGTGRYLAVALLFALGLMAKPMLVTLPLVLLLLDLWPLRRWPRGAAAEEGALVGPSPARPASPAGLLLEKLPLLILSAASAVVTAAAQEEGGAIRSADVLPMASRLVNTPLAYVAYLRKLVWPVDLACFYPHPALVRHEAGETLAPSAWLAAALLVALTVAVLVAARRSRGRLSYLAVGWLWFAGMLVPVIGLVQVGAQSMADRYAYLPVVGLELAVVWAVADLVRRRPGARVAAVVALLAAAGALALRARDQVPTWRDSVTLYRHAVAVTQDNFMAHNNLGLLLAQQGDLEGADHHLGESVRIRPQYFRPWINLGNTALARGNHEEAAARYRRALLLRPDDADAHNNLGAALEAMGELGAAAQHRAQALRLRPAFFEAAYGLGLLAIRLDDLDRARRNIAHALRLRPELAEGHNNLGMIHRLQGDLAAARRSFEEALRLRPGYETAQANLAAVRERLEQP